MIETNKVYEMDAFELLQQLPDKYVDAVVIDPPFGIGFKYEKKEENNNPDEYWSWLKPIYEECLRVLKDGGFIAIWQTQLYFKFFWSWFGDDIQIYAGCKNFVQLRKTAINRGYDPIIMKYKPANELLRPKKPKRNIDFFVANTAKWVTQTEDIVRKHPCPRPIDQVEQIIENFTIPNGLVLDCFVGSGTTAVACKKLNRNFICCDNNAGYVEIANKRLAQQSVADFTSATPTLAKPKEFNKGLEVSATPTPKSPSATSPNPNIKSLNSQNETKKTKKNKE